MQCLLYPMTALQHRNINTYVHKPVCVSVRLYVRIYVSGVVEPRTTNLNRVSKVWNCRAERVLIEYQRGPANICFPCLSVHSKVF